MLVEGKQGGGGGSEGGRGGGGGDETARRNPGNHGNADSLSRRPCEVGVGARTSHATLPLPLSGGVRVSGVSASRCALRLINCWSPLPERGRPRPAAWRERESGERWREK